MSEYGFELCGEEERSGSGVNPQVVIQTKGKVSISVNQQPAGGGYQIKIVAGQASSSEEAPQEPPTPVSACSPPSGSVPSTLSTAASLPLPRRGYVALVGPPTADVLRLAKALRAPAGLASTQARIFRAWTWGRYLATGLGCDLRAAVELGTPTVSSVVWVFFYVASGQDPVCITNKTRADKFVAHNRVRGQSFGSQAEATACLAVASFSLAGALDRGAQLQI
jgi:hypothetical protein